MADGATVMLVPVTDPIPGLTDSDVAPDTLQASVEEPPGVMIEGVAANEEMTGPVTLPKKSRILRKVSWSQAPAEAQVT